MPVPPSFAGGFGRDSPTAGATRTTRMEDASPASPSPAVLRRGPIRRLYDWTLSWADRPGGTIALFLLAVAESSFFPIPPDVLLIAMVLGRRQRAMWFAAVVTTGSVIGGIIGYYIGLGLFEQLGRPILEMYQVMDKFEWVGDRYRENLVIALGTAAFTPVPYKVFTIAAGAFAVPLVPFILISCVGRGGRFFLVATLIYFFGPPIRRVIDRYFNLLTILFVVILVGGFWVARVMSR